MRAPGIPQGVSGTSGLIRKCSWNYSGRHRDPLGGRCRGGGTGRRGPDPPRPPPHPRPPASPLVPASRGREGGTRDPGGTEGDGSPHPGWRSSDTIVFLLLCFFGFFFFWRRGGRGRDAGTRRTPTRSCGGLRERSSAGKKLRPPAGPPAGSEPGGAAPGRAAGGPAPQSRPPLLRLRR